MDQKLRVGRLLRGKSEKDFHWLSPDPERQLVFLFDYFILQKIRNQLQVSWLDVLGYPQEFKNQLRQEGYLFKLIHFEIPKTKICLATWANLLSLLQDLGYLELVAKLTNQGYHQLDPVYKQKLSQVAQINQCYQGNGYLYSKSWPSDLSCREFLFLNQEINQIECYDLSVELVL